MTQCIVNNQDDITKCIVNNQDDMTQCLLIIKMIWHNA